jgi:protein involved in polysaccharide export with SLBB domain
MSGIADIPLEPYDAVTIRRKAGYTIPETMTVAGQVQFPGPYALESRNERVSAILKRAGGYTPDAYPEGAYLKRFKTEIEKQRAAEVLKKLQKSVGDTTNNEVVAQEVTKEYNQIPLDLLASIRSLGSIQDIVVRAGDELYIPKFNDQVKISGAVLLSTQVPYQKRNNLKDYISEAGGFSGDAWPKKAYVVYANGKAATIDRFFLFKFYPKILPGSEVVVPQKPERKSTNVGEVIGIASALASLAGVVIAILRL